MESFNNEMSEIDKQIQELQEKKKQLELEKQKLPTIVTLDAFNPTLGRIHVLNSEYHAPLVDELRKYPNRLYTNGYNVINVLEVPKLKVWIENWNIYCEVNGTKKIELKYGNTKIEEQINDWLSAPDLDIKLDRLGYIRIYPGPKFSARRLFIYGNDLSSFQYAGSHYTININEAWKLPTAIQSSLGKDLKINWEDEVTDVIIEQTTKSKLLAEVANAEDYPLTNIFIDPYEQRPWQRVADKFLDVIDDVGIVGYDMGLGKSSIGIARALRKGYKKVLIVCPATLKLNWAREVEKFAGEKANILSGMEPTMLDFELIKSDKYRFHIINYDVLARSSKKDDSGSESLSKWHIIFAAAGFELLIIDEAHYIKNTDSKRSQAVRQLKIPKVIGMTGTPIVNRPGELYPILSMLDPKTFHNEAQFVDQFTDNEGNARNIKQLHEILSRYMIRRSFADIYKDLEAVNRITFTKSLSSEARELYTKILKGIYVSLRKPDFQREVNGILAEIQRCKQACSSDNVETSVELALNALEETGKKVLIFSQFKESHAAINQQLGPISTIINGEVGFDKRMELVDKFQDKNSNLKVVVTNILEGLTLTEAHTVIFNDFWWTPKDHRQAEGRAFGRTNDPHSGNSYYIQNENTIDTFLVALLHKKMEIFSQVIDGVPQSQEANASLFGELLKHLKENM